MNGVRFLDAQGYAEREISERSARIQGYSNEGFAGADPLDTYNSRWTPYARDPNIELERHLRYAWARSYEQHRNNAMVYGPTDVLATAVGELIPNPKVSDPDIRARLLDGWEEFRKQASSDGVTTWGDLCQRIVGAACQGGDVGVSFEIRKDISKQMPVRLALHDAYLINTPYNLDTTETVKIGVVYDQGREVAYYRAKTESPQGRTDYYRFLADNEGQPNFRLFRRPTANRRPSQTRVEPAPTSVLRQAKEIEDYRRAFVRGAGKRERLALILKSPDPGVTESLFAKIKMAQDQNNPKLADALRAGSRPNSVTTPDAVTYNIPNSTDVVFPPVDNIDSQYPPYIMMELKTLVIPWGLPWEIAYLILGGASYSTARILSLRSGATAQRWITGMGSYIGDPTWRLVVQQLVARDRKLRLQDGADLYRVDWHGRAQEYQDIGREVSAEAEARANSIMSPQSAARRTGNDAMQILEEQAQYVSRRKEMMVKYNITEDEWNATFAPSKDKTTPIPSEPGHSTGDPAKDPP